MYKIGQYVVYKRDVCKIKAIKEKYIKGNDYYVLSSMDDESLIIHVPVDNSNLLRDLISKKELENIIKSIPDIPIIESEDRLIENEYKKLLYSENHSDLIKIIKTTYLRNQNRLENNKKLSEKDSFYFEKAEKYLYNEFSIILNKSFEETKEYIINKLK